MESKVVEIGGQFVVRVRDRNAGGWKDDKSFGTVAEAQTREAELRLEEERTNDRLAAGDKPKLSAADKREVKEEAEASVNKAGAEQAQDVAENRAVREAELAGREPPEFKHEQPRGARRR